ncbi:MAG: DUF1553 domain-containing protein, partial [Planctomycetota bacterium]
MPLVRPVAADEIQTDPTADDSKQPATMPDLGTIPAGVVQVTITEGFANAKHWPTRQSGASVEPPGEPLMVFSLDSFYFHRVPARFDDWGIRKSWHAPLLIRMAADVEIPPGKHRFLTRVRSLSRLWIDGELVSSTDANRIRKGNLEPINAVPPPPVPGARPLPFAQQESFVEFEVPAKNNSGTTDQQRRVILEWIVGGRKQRTESGEVVVAIAPGTPLHNPSGSREPTDSQPGLFVLKPNPNETLSLTDDAIGKQQNKNERILIAIEDQRRRRARKSRIDYWKSRHAIANAYVNEHDSATHTPTTRTIDQWISDKLNRAASQSMQHDEPTIAFFNNRVLPILRDECFRCHGEKESGGLRLNTRQAILGSGESELLAVVPGKPEESELIAQVRDRIMPPTQQGLSDQQIKTLERWVLMGAPWPAASLSPDQTQPAPMINDAAFLRRATLDTIGHGPTADEVREFLADDDPAKRTKWVDRLLRDDRFADHWVSLFLDLLAENPTLLNSSIGSTGPFRWYLHDALKDNVPYDQMVTELLMMRGDVAAGGSAGFAIAGENDSPMAAKAHIAASAFLGIQLQCARCHDSPYHSTTQQDLYSLAAMLGRKSLTPPKSSRVPDAFFESAGRQSLIKVTLKPNVAVDPKWPFGAQTGANDGPLIESLLTDPSDHRERFAALVTSPSNQRFAAVIVNHLWHRLIGAGLVQPLDDWEGRTSSHPELLNQLSRDLIMSGYDLKSTIRQIMTSKLYARQAIGQNGDQEAATRFFNAPDPRRLTAEQIVDSLFHASGRAMDTEEITFVHDGSLPMKKRLSLGRPKRAWQFAGLNNERDRPSLSMPRARSIVDVLHAFGWTGTRQQPIVSRDTEPNVLQPGILANGTLTMSLTRAAYQQPLAKLALGAESPGELVDELFLRFLGRFPNQQERVTFTKALRSGFDDRKLDQRQFELPLPDPPLPQSTWSNHLLPEANEVQIEWLRRVRRGPPVDPRIRPAWREVFEDVVWSLVNHREFVWTP